MPITPTEKYHQALAQQGYSPDTAQVRALALFDGLYRRIEGPRPGVGHSRWIRLIPGRSKQHSIRGIYLWGGVGRGKTFIMDIFYRCLPPGTAKRIHFHDFMNQIHRELKQHAGLEDPLRKIARGIAGKMKLLCLDEFIITDIGDAMIMAGLLESLFDCGVVLVTTSNTVPQNLYRDGLQRARFLPAIELIERHCEVVLLDSEEDYRLQKLQQTDLYTVPHSSAAEQKIRRYLGDHEIESRDSRDTLTINGRELLYEACSEDMVWFSFDALCKTNRSQTDYLEIARLFNTLILTEVESMDALQDDIARRFVLLIDILYDHRVKLICTAEVRPDRLYDGVRLAFEFERTSSRLIEMQSSQYLAQAHRVE